MLFKDVSAFLGWNSIAGVAFVFKLSKKFIEVDLDPLFWGFVFRAKKVLVVADEDFFWLKKLNNRGFSFDLSSGHVSE